MWLVGYGEYSDQYVRAAFLSEEEATAYMRIWDNNGDSNAWIYDVPLNPAIFDPAVKIYVVYDETTQSITRIGQDETRWYYWPVYPEYEVAVTVTPALQKEMLASPDPAKSPLLLKIVRDMVAKQKAEQENL